MFAPRFQRLASFAIACVLALTAQAQTVVRVLHYNIHRDIGGTDSNVASQPALAKVVNHLAPDVWAINELGGNGSAFNATTAHDRLVAFINASLTIFGPSPQEGVNYFVYIGENIAGQAANNIPGTGALLNITDPAATAPRFYRIVTSQ